MTVSAALLSDIIAGKINPSVAHAANGTTRNMIKMCELQLRYGGGINGKAQPITIVEARREE